MNLAAKKRLIFLLFMMGLFMAGCTQTRGLFKHGQKPGNTSAAWHKATMKSYNVRGKRYQPTYVATGDVMRGISSWYGPNFHGKYTSNGEVYNMYSRTAAHKTWPMDTMVRVTNLDNGKSTTVRINDRGPFVSGRIIDCSYAAGKELGLDKSGIAKVTIEVLDASRHSKKMINQKPAITCKIESVKKTSIAPQIALQVAAFKSLDGAETFRESQVGMYENYTPTIKTFSTLEGEKLYRVLLVGFTSEEEAREFRERNNMAGAAVVIN